MRILPLEVIKTARSAAALVLTLLSAIAAAHATTATESTLFTFPGDEPSQLIQAHDGNFYGTSPTGGSASAGYVFQLTAGGAEMVIYNFTNGADGGTPKAGVIEGNDGNLYGTNTTGGSGSGVLFSLTLAGAITPLHAFAGATEGTNAGALIQNSAGDIFGAAVDGGASGFGTVFEYTHTGSFVLVHSFSGSAGDGAFPNSELLQASDGLIYGATVRGGTLSNGGSLYRFEPATLGSLATIASFPPTGLSDPFYNPAFGMTEGPDGALYGLTAEGGNGYGSIYRVVPGSTPTVTLDLYDLINSTNGGIPASGFFLGGDGNLYGTTSAYGPGGPPNGTFFEYLPGTGVFTALYGFTPSNGTASATPLESADGLFYGPASAAIYKMVLTPAIAAPVNLTASAATITLGSSVTLTWLVNNAFSQTMEDCYAHGAWAGSLALSGSETVTPGATGTFNYSLTCGGIESAMIVVNVVPAVSPTATPVITPASGSYSRPVVYDITDATPGAVIYYTTDGSTPTVASPVWNNIPKVIVSSTTVQAIALAPGFSVSSVAAANYTITISRRGNCEIEYPRGFAVHPLLQLNNGALIAGPILDLTHGLFHERTSAFDKVRIPLAVFATEFRFRILKADPKSSEGFTFTVQANSDTEVGSADGGLGYKGIPHSMALKFDLHNDAGEGTNSVGLFFGGAFPAIPAIDLTPSGLDLHSAHIFGAYVTYDTHFLNLTLTDTVTSATFTHSFHLPAASPFGAPTAFAGFTASTGAQTSAAQILDWTLESKGSCRRSF